MNTHLRPGSKIYILEKVIILLEFSFVRSGFCIFKYVFNFFFGSGFRIHIQIHIKYVILVPDLGSNLIYVLSWGS